MSIKINEIIEDDIIICGVCHEQFKTNEITTDDYNFAWDNYVSVDCCSACSSKVLSFSNYPNEDPTMDINRF